MKEIDMGPYCKFCDQRCFVQRVLKDGRWMILATCPRGMEHDRTQVGEDHATAINPAAHRCQWDMPDDVQPDSEQCPDEAIDGGQLCQTHQDQHDDLMDAMARDEGAYEIR